MTDNSTTSSNGQAHSENSAFTVNGASEHMNELQTQLSIPQRNADLDAWMARLRVRPTDVIEEAPTCLTIEQNGKSYPIASLGNLTMAIGKAKVRKTFVISVAIAAAIGNCVVMKRIRGSLPENKQTVLFFDTEQALQDVFKVVKRICKLSNLDTVDPENLEVYSLRGCSPEERLMLIEYYINITPNVGLVVIDGIRDLAVDPISDAAQANKITTCLLQWSTQLNIHILCVLHQNKGDNNARGFIGTELVNKAETVMTISKDSHDKEVSIVSSEHGRGRDFEPFGFSIDENGLPYSIDEDIQLNSSQLKVKVRKPKADTLSQEEIMAVLQRVFQKEALLRYGQLVINLGEASSFVGVSLGRTECEKLITRVTNASLLVKIRPDKFKWDVYKLNDTPSTDQPF